MMFSWGFFEEPFFFRRNSPSPSDRPAVNQGGIRVHDESNWRLPVTISDPNQSWLPKTHQLLNCPAHANVLKFRICALAELLGWDYSKVMFINDLALIVVRPDLAMIILEFHEGIAPKLDQCLPFRSNPPAIAALDREVHGMLQLVAVKPLPELLTLLKPRLDACLSGRSITSGEDAEEVIVARTPFKGTKVPAAP